VLEAQLAGFWLFEADRTGWLGGSPSPEMHDVVQAKEGTWRLYTAEEFHRETLKNCGLHMMPEGTP
jgi:hypothetical protein